MANPIPERYLSTWDFAKHFKAYLQTECVPNLVSHLTKKGLISGGSIPVVIGGRIPISFPAESKAVIRVVKDTKRTQWMATGTKKDTYSLFIDCLIRVIADKEVMDFFIDEFASYVNAFLNRKSKLQFQVKDSNVSVFNSWAEEVQTGYAEQGALRVARLPWIGWVANIVEG